METDINKKSALITEKDKIIKKQNSTIIIK